MLFLIEYERNAGTVRSMTEFPDTALREAQDARLRLEIDLRQRNVDHEVVVLEAASKAALLETHARYFRSIDAISSSAGIT